MSAVGTGRRLAVLLGCVVVGAGCTSTTTGTAVMPAQPPDGGAVVSLMDTGPYATAARRTYGAIGAADVEGQNLLEAHRLADFTVGPWETDRDVRLLPGAIQAGMIGPIASVKMMGDNGIFKESIQEIARVRGFSFGFSTVRVTPEDATQTRQLQNIVMKFPDPPAAAAAAAEMRIQATGPPGAPPGRPVPIPNTPEALAVLYDLPDRSQVVDSFTAHGPYVLFQSARVTDAFLGAAPAVLVDGVLGLQKRRIDEFAPTDPAALPDLPLDPTGQLLARTLTAPDNRAPFIIGVWQPRGWLHFEYDPVASGALFDTAGVDVVTQQLTTVYQAANADGARRVVDEFAAQMKGMKSVLPIKGVQGLPVARCFQRTIGAVPSTSAASWQRMAWAFKCVASTDRYAYTAFSADPDDVRQQMAAQYRMLAGE